MRYCTVSNAPHDVAQQVVFNNLAYLYASDGHVLVVSENDWLQQLFLNGYRNAANEEKPSETELAYTDVNEEALLALFPVGSKCHYYVQSDEYKRLAGALVSPEGELNVDRVLAYIDPRKPCPLVKLAQLMGIPCTNLANPTVLYKAQDVVMDRTLPF